MKSRIYPRLSVENFGPIKSGTIELKPLTIFIGPNNSGKSYMATLAYALLQSINTQFGLPSIVNGKIYARVFPVRTDDQYDAEMPIVEEWMAALTHYQANDQAHFGEYPVAVQALLLRDLSHDVQLFERTLPSLIAEYFQVSSLSEVVRLPFNVGHFNLGTDAQASNFLDARIDNSGSHISIGVMQEWLTPEVFPLRLWRRSIDGLSPEDQARFIRERLNEAIRLVIFAKYGLRVDKSYYLPSARSGILQNYQTFVAVAFSALRNRIGSETLPAFQGVMGDFFEELSRNISRYSGSTAFAAALEVLEEKVLQGKIMIRQGPTSQPQIIYSSHQYELPIERASSMVAELAPLVLWINNLKQFESIFIDEPEAHLHPENQRQVARALVRLANGGAQVVCPTHSSLILHQISNSLMASKLSAEKRAEFGYTEDDLINAHDVGVYLFSMEEDGTVIQSVEIDPEFGIDEEEFVRVFQAIGNETYDLSEAAQWEPESAVQP